MRRTALACALLAACGANSAAVDVAITLPAGHTLALEHVVFSPRGHVRGLLRDGDTLRFSSDGAALTVEAPGLCPVKVARGARSVRAARLVEVPEALAQLGYDAPFALDVKAGCEEGERYTLDWRVAEGELAAFTSEARGFRVRGRTLPLDALFTAPLPRGVVPVSPRTQGRALLAWSASARGLPDVHGTLTVSAIARATGLTSLAVGQRVMLGGGDYSLVRAPGGSHAALGSESGVPTFTPDVAGRFQLRGPGGERVDIQAMRHDHTPMDCGRAECHAAISASTLLSPMSHALSHPALDLRADRSCMLGCHSVGEPGLDDGGFASLRAALGHTAPLDGAHLGALPPPLARMAGVRCTSCHGPGAIPTQGGRARVLRSDVCATCHDAPPRYTHVAEWRSSAMARSDSHAGSDAPACAACHTTGGFLHRTGLRVRDDLSRDDTAVGITCAACHAPHGPRLAQGLLRDFDGPSALPKGSALAHTPSALCAQCHAPQADGALPEASSAALWLGSAAFPAALGGEPLGGPAPHAALPGGCLACHGKREHDAGTRTHTGHDFAVAPGTCAACHADGVPDAGSAQLTARLAGLRARLPASCASPADAHSRGPSPCESAALGRARYALELVARDAGAHAHNAPFARALLDRAEAELARPR